MDGSICNLPKYPKSGSRGRYDSPSLQIFVLETMYMLDRIVQVQG
jgi:hypothetical protein